MKISYQDFINSDCKLADSMKRKTLFINDKLNLLDLFGFRNLYNVTKEDPCTTGCAWFNNATCPTYKRFLNITKDIKKETIIPETNAQIASELGISKRQVAKMRKEGTLTEIN